MSGQRVLFTVGYEGRDVEEFVELLKSHGIEMVVDVRELPLSRKRGFSKTPLATRLEAAGIAYVHMPSLGCDRDLRAWYRKTRDVPGFAARFAEYLRTQGDALEDLRERALTHRLCLVCFERDPAVCHRSIVADRVRHEGRLAVQHLV